MYLTPANTASLLITALLILFSSTVSAHSTNTDFSTFEHTFCNGAKGEIDCSRLRPAKIDKHICYLGYQAAIRDGDVIVDLSVWNSNCNKIGYATFIPPNGKFGLKSQLQYLAVAKLSSKNWERPPSVDYAGRHFASNSDEAAEEYRSQCYYPDENNPHYKPELRKAAINCLVPFGCEWWVN
ncbi:hypothetical protein ONS96_001785 [Cadophora gregata f. sp. sojae]|nr:hypothetical protein ONS96_001785 [Cadophora gregata f. sp. sojae]